MAAADTVYLEVILVSWLRECAESKIAGSRTRSGMFRDPGLEFLRDPDLDCDLDLLLMRIGEYYVSPLDCKTG